MDLVIEAIFEGLALKKEVFRELDRVCKPGAILASNTSTLSIDEIASATSRPECVIGAHFFSPANVMRLLEIVRGKNTSKEVIATCMQLSKALGKVGVLVGNCRGLSAIACPIHTAARLSSLSKKAPGLQRLTRRSLTSEWPWDRWLPATLRGSMWAGGSGRNIVIWNSRAFVSRSLKTGSANSADTDKKQQWAGTNMMSSAARCQIPKWMNWFGSGSRMRALRSVKSRPRKSLDRCIYSLVNEGARTLQEGYALRASDIDIIYLSGYGFPAYRGGPMWYADTVGLKQGLRPSLRIASPPRRNVAARPATAATCRRGQDFRKFRQGRRSGAVIVNPRKQDDAVTIVLLPFHLLFSVLTHRRAFRMASPQVFCGWKWPGTDPARSALEEQPRVYVRAPPRQRCRVAPIPRL